MNYLRKLGFMANSVKRGANSGARLSNLADPTTRSRGGPIARQKETAQYLADMILELRVLAKSAELYHVMVPLEYAYYEAFSAANRIEVSVEDLARLEELSAVSRESDIPPED